MLVSFARFFFLTLYMGTICPQTNIKLEIIGMFYEENPYKCNMGLAVGVGDR